ncbi:MAG: zinc ribbon domain-containing protein [Candidatus Dormibacteria bacterium]
MAAISPTIALPAPSSLLAIFGLLGNLLTPDPFTTIVASLPRPILAFGEDAELRLADWYARRGRKSKVAIELVRAARRSDNHEYAIALLRMALQNDPKCAQAQFDLAQDLYDLSQFAEASTLYTSYLWLRPGHLYARKKLAESLLKSGQPDAAVPIILQIREDPRLAEESRNSGTAMLAMAYIKKGEFSQAVEFCNLVIANKRSLDAGAQQCLHFRGIASYLLGQRAAGLRDLERLFAMDPTREHLAQEKAEMASGTFTLDGYSPATTAIAANCPACGAPTQHGATSCPFCRASYPTTGSELVHL